MKPSQNTARYLGPLSAFAGNESKLKVQETPQAPSSAERCFYCWAFSRFMPELRDAAGDLPERLLSLLLHRARL